MSVAKRHARSEKSFTPGMALTIVSISTYFGCAFQVAGSLGSQSFLASVWLRSWKRNQLCGPTKSLRRVLLRSGVEQGTGSSNGFGRRRSRAAMAAFSSLSTRSEKIARMTWRSWTAVHWREYFLKTASEIPLSILGCGTVWICIKVHSFFYKHTLFLWLRLIVFKKFPFSGWDVFSNVFKKSRISGWLCL